MSFCKLELALPRRRVSGGSVITMACGKPVGPLRQFQLTVSAVTFADGKTGSRELPHNKSDASRGSVFRMKLL